eukprot:3573719-Rhodomonas_salina.2
MAGCWVEAAVRLPESNSLLIVIESKLLIRIFMRFGLELLTALQGTRLGSNLFVFSGLGEGRALTCEGFEAVQHCVRELLSARGAEK